MPTPAIVFPHLNNKLRLLARNSPRHAQPRHTAVRRVSAGLKPAVVLPLACSQAAGKRMGQGGRGRQQVGRPKGSKAGGKCR